MEQKSVPIPFTPRWSNPQPRATREATTFVANQAGIVPAVYSRQPPGASRKPGSAEALQRLRWTASIALAAILLSWQPAGGACGELALAADAPQAAPSPVAATEAVSPPSFLIEKVVVEGARHGSEKIVVAETLLRPGSSYTEAQLREALQRVERLPFVVLADFSLRRGTERGNFELVITVTETKPIFFGGSFAVIRSGGSHPGDWVLFGLPEVGARVFTGGHSELSGGLGGFGVASNGDSHSDLGFHVAYTHHNLFGRHVAGGVFVDAGPFGRQEIGTEVAFPLNRANVLILDIRRSRSGSESSAPGLEFEDTANTVKVAWNRDTTDNPFTPHRGTRTGATIGYSTSDYRQSSPWGFGPYQGRPPETTLRIGRESGPSGSLQGSHYWSLPRRLSLGLEASLSGSREGVRGTATRGDVVESDDGDKWSMNGLVKARLIGTIPGRPGGTTHQWWEVAASLSGFRFRTEWDPPGAYESYDGRSTSGLLSVSVASRGRWGTVVLSLQYLHQYLSRYDWQ